VIGKRAPKFRFLGFLVLFVILSLMIMRGKSYYTQGVWPFLIAAGAASYDLRLKTRFVKYLIPIMIVLLTIPLIPIAIPVYKSEGLVKYFNARRLARSTVAHVVTPHLFVTSLSA
jgi:hypothetical protein